MKLQPEKILHDVQDPRSKVYKISLQSRSMERPDCICIEPVIAKGFPHRTGSKVVKSTNFSQREEYVATYQTEDNEPSGPGFAIAAMIFAFFATDASDASICKCFIHRPHFMCARSTVFQNFLPF